MEEGTTQGSAHQQQCITSAVYIDEQIKTNTSINIKVYKKIIYLHAGKH